jgi:hypothetical protein
MPASPWRDAYEAIGAGMLDMLPGYYTGEKRLNFTRRALIDVETLPYQSASTTLSFNPKTVLCFDFGKLRNGVNNTRQVHYNGISTATTGQVMNIRYTDSNVGSVFATNQAHI